jgi:hypothetical protein
VRRVVEELCDDDACQLKPDTHWHPLSLESLLALKDGEYSLTVRVRTLGKRKTRYSVVGFGRRKR